MRYTLLLSILVVAALPALANTSKSHQLVRGSTAIVVPARLLHSQRRANIPEYDELYLRQVEGRSRTVKQYLTHGAQEQMVDPNSIYFGFRDNQNEKKVKITVDLANQTATLTSPVVDQRVMRVSTGMPGYSTEKYVGCYQIKGTEKVHYSKQFNNAPMPNATKFIETAGIFFHTGDLGSRSHGCIRMAPQDSKFVMDHVNKYSRLVYDVMTSRQKRVYDVEVCIENGVASKVAAPQKTPKPAVPRRTATTWYDRLFQLQAEQGIR